MAGDPFYKSEEWRKFRKGFIADNPVCSAPNCSKPSRHVDHIVSRRKGGNPLSAKNSQALCWSCHSRKTAMIDGGFGNKQRSDLSGVVGCDPAGNPMDPLHRWNRS